MTAAEKSNFVCGHRTRYGVLVVGTLCFSLFMADGAAFYSSLILMTDVSSSPLYVNGSTVDMDYGSWNIPLADRRFDYSPYEKSWLIGGLFIGCLIGVGPLTVLMNRYGAHQTLTTIGATVTILTVTVPFIATAGFPFLVIHRIIHGIVMSNIFPIIGEILTKWSPTTENGLFLSLLTGHLQISMIISTPLAGFVGKRFGWPAILFTHAALSGLITAAWATCYRNEPVIHPCVSEKEFTKITTGKSTETSRKATKPPYRQILTSLPIWAVWVATAGNYIVSQFPITFFYMYLVSALGMDVETAGLLSAVPFISQLILKFITGLVSDRIGFMSELNKCRFFNSLAFYGGAFFFVLVALLHPEHNLLCALLIAAQAMIGFNPGGFNLSAVLVSRQHSPTVLAVIQVVLCVSLFFGSFIVSFFAPCETSGEYAHLFLLYAAILVVSNTFFIVFCSVEAAEWTKEKSEEEKGTPPL